MDPRCVYLQKHQVPELIDQLVAKLVEAQPQNPRQYLANQLVALSAASYGARDYVPPQGTSNAVVATAMLPEMYLKLRSTQTAAGSTLDDCLVDGYDYATAGRPLLPGQVAVSGLAATDADCFTTLADVFDAVVQAKHGRSYVARSAPFYVQDFTVGKVRGGFSFDERRVRSITCRLRRNIAGFHLAPALSRAERREVERLVTGACSTFVGSDSGVLHRVANMPSVLPTKPRNAPLLLPQFHQSPVRSAYREWPDARSVFVADDNAAAVHANCGSEHIEVVSVASQNNNVREAFDRGSAWMAHIEDALREAGKELMSHPRLGALTADLDLIGSGLTVSFVLDLPHFAKHPKFGDALRKVKLRLETDFTINPPPTVVAGPAATPSAAVELGASESVEDDANGATAPVPDEASTGDAISSIGAAAPTPQADSLGVTPAAGSRTAMAGAGGPVRNPFRVANIDTLSGSPIEVLQVVIDGVTKLIELEAAIAKNQGAGGMSAADTSMELA